MRAAALAPAARAGGVGRPGAAETAGCRSCRGARTLPSPPGRGAPAFALFLPRRRARAAPSHAPEPAAAASTRFGGGFDSSIDDPPPPATNGKHHGGASAASPPAAAPAPTEGRPAVAAGPDYTATLLVKCPDQKGVVASLAQLLYGLGCNIITVRGMTMETLFTICIIRKNNKKHSRTNTRTWRTASTSSAWCAQGGMSGENGCDRRWAGRRPT